ncbi:MAG: response regulator transcription factor [Rickettsiales bacterium]
MHILIVEDDEVTGQYITDGLKEAGHNADWAKDGMEGLYMATEGIYDALVVDRMLPKIDGLAMIQTLRQSSNHTPALVLSALNQVEERIKGLRSGGDDYLTKPFSFAELLARVEALVRRTASPTEQTVLKFSDLELNLLHRKVMRSGKEIALLNREFRLLEYMMRRPGQVITRTMLLEGVWDFHFNPQTNLIDAQISRLRQKIDKGFEKPLIHTLRGVGYKLDVA